MCVFPCAFFLPLITFARYQLASINSKLCRHFVDNILRQPSFELFFLYFYFLSFPSTCFGNNFYFTFFFRFFHSYVTYVIISSFGISISFPKAISSFFHRFFLFRSENGMVSFRFAHVMCMCTTRVPFDGNTFN